MHVSACVRCMPVCVYVSVRARALGREGGAYQHQLGRVNDATVRTQPSPLVMERPHTPHP